MIPVIALRYATILEFIMKNGPVTVRDIAAHLRAIRLEDYSSWIPMDFKHVVIKLKAEGLIEQERIKWPLSTVVYRVVSQRRAQQVLKTLNQEFRALCISDSQAEKS